MKTRYSNGMDALPPLESTEFEDRIAAALERRAEPAVPADFAVRIVGALPAVRPARRRVHAARMAGIACAVVLLALMLYMAPRSTASFSSFAFDAELLFTAQLAAIAAWLALSQSKV